MTWQLGPKNQVSISTYLTKDKINITWYDVIKNIPVTVGNYKTNEKEERELLLHTILDYLTDSPKIPEIITRSGNQRDCSSPKDVRSKLPSKGNVLFKTDTDEAEYSI